MANIQSFQVAQNTPVASHGMGGDVKVMHFVVTMPVTANADTIEFGRLPDYAVPIGARIIHTATASVDVGITGDGDGFFDGITLAANVPQQTALSTLLGKNVGLGGVAVTGVCNGAGTAGTLHLFIEYIVEDAGVAYSYIAAV